MVSRVKVEMYCRTARLPAMPQPAVPPPTTEPPATPPSAGKNGLAATDNARDQVEALARALVAAVRVGPAWSAEPEPDADAIATRLLTPSEPVAAVDEAARGRSTGRAWAARRARLDELEALAALAARDDWTAVALPEGHTLLEFLAGTGDLDAAETGPIDLRRDEFTAGVVAGAAQTYGEVAPRLPPAPID